MKPAEHAHEPRKTAKRMPVRRRSSHWIGIHHDRIAGRDRSLARLMRRMNRDGMPAQECAFQMVPRPLDEIKAG